MSVLEAREILLEQHGALRGKIGEARRASELWRQGTQSREELQRLLSQLSEKLFEHHACEERLLRDLVPTVDAWGKERAERMVETHTEEHRSFLASLDDCAACASADEGATLVAVLLDSLLDHMRDEEVYLLACDVLTDDLRFGEGFAG